MLSNHGTMTFAGMPTTLCMAVAMLSASACTAEESTGDAAIDRPVADNATHYGPLEGDFDALAGTTIATLSGQASSPLVIFIPGQESDEIQLHLIINGETVQIFSSHPDEHGLLVIPSLPPIESGAALLELRGGNRLIVSLEVVYVEQEILTTVLEEYPEIVVGESEKSLLVDERLLEAQPGMLSMSIDDEGMTEEGDGLRFTTCDTSTMYYTGKGKVYWDNPNPGSGGQYFSVYPESSQSVIWAKYPSQMIDGICRRGWGEGVAFKVPDNCQATVSYSGSTIYWCCHWLTQLAWKPKWVNSSTDPYFYLCPL